MNHVAIWVFRVLGPLCLFMALSAKGGTGAEIGFFAWLIGELIYGLRVKDDAVKVVQEVEDKGGENE